MLWQLFSYEQLVDICYVCGLIGRTIESSGYVGSQGAKQLFGPWIRATRVPISPMMAQGHRNNQGSSPLSE